MLTTALYLTALALMPVAINIPVTPTTLSQSFNTSWVTANPRGPGNAVYVRPGVYDYAPSIMKDASFGGKYRMWWCGGIAGDHILYAESTSLDGPWHGNGKTDPNSFDDVFQPTGGIDDWDGLHTCDPSVVHANGSYWLYYGGFPQPGSSKTQVTALGVAKSSDGITWQRVRSTPVVTAARSQSEVPNGYGAGQPSAIFMLDDKKVYLAFTDTTGKSSNWANGAGIYVWRSKDPTFVTGVEELGSNGWAPFDPNNQRTRSIWDAYSISWAYSVTLPGFIMTVNAGAQGASFTTFDRQVGYRPLPTGIISGPGMNDGPGLVTDSHGQIKSVGTKIPLDILYAISDGSGDTSPNGWDLGHAGLDLVLAP